MEWCQTGFSFRLYNASCGVLPLVMELLDPSAVSCIRFRTVMCYPINCDGLGESETVRTPSLGPVLVTIGCPIGVFILLFY